MTTTTTIMQASFDAFQRDIVARRRPNATASRSTDGTPFTVPDHERLTPFHSRVVPRCSLWEMASIIGRTLRADAEILLAALVLVKRYDAMAKFQQVTEHMMHRLYVACLQVAMKAHCDVFYTNRAFAKAVGVTPKELNQLECAMVEAVDWSVQVSNNEIEALLAVGSPQSDKGRSTSPASRSSSPQSFEPRRFTPKPSPPADACHEDDFRPKDHLVASSDAL